LLRGRFGQPDVGTSQPSPTTGYREKDVRHLIDQRLLQCGGQHEVAVPQVLHRECCENAAPDTEVGRAHVRTLLRSVEAQRHLSKVFRIHQFMWPIAPDGCRNLSGEQPGKGVEPAPQKFGVGLSPAAPRKAFETIHLARDVTAAARPTRFNSASYPMP